MDEEEETVVEEEEEELLGADDTKRRAGGGGDLSLLRELETWRLVTILAMVCGWYGVVMVWEDKARPYWFDGVSAKRRAVLDMLTFVPWGFRLAASEVGATGHGALLASEAAGAFAFSAMGLAPSGSLSQLTSAGVLAVVQGATVVHLVTLNKLASEAVRASSDPRALTSIFWLIGKPAEMVSLAVAGAVLQWAPVRAAYFPGLASASAAVFFLVVFSAVAERSSTIKRSRVASLKPAATIDDHIKSVRRTGTYDVLRAGVVLGTASTALTSLSQSSLNDNTRLAIALVATIVFGLAPLSILLNRELALIGAFFVIRTCFQVDIRSSTFLFYTEDVPGLPRLSPFFVSTVLGYVGLSSALLGVLIYKSLLAGWQTRKVFQFVAASTCLVQLSAVPLIYWRFFQASPLLDKLVILIEEAVAVAVFNVNDVPLTLLVATRCTPGDDAAVFALLGTCRHFANQVAPLAGNVLLTLVRANARDTPDLADGRALGRLWIAKLVVAFLPLVPAFSPFITMIPSDDIGAADAARPRPHHSGHTTDASPSIELQPRRRAPSITSSVVV